MSWLRSLKQPSNGHSSMPTPILKTKLTSRKLNKRDQIAELWRSKKEKTRSYTSSASKPDWSPNFKFLNSAQMKTKNLPLISSPTDSPSPITNTTINPKFSSLTSIIRIKTLPASADTLQMETHLRLWLGTKLHSHLSLSKTMGHRHLIGQGILICPKHHSTVVAVRWIRL